MSNNNFIDNILCEINSGLNVTAVGLCVFSSLSFVLNMIIILDINKLKKENNKIKNLNYEIKQQNEKTKQQNEKMLLKLSLLNDTIFNNKRIILNDIYFQLSNLFEIIDKIDYLTNEKKTNEKNKICEEKNIITYDKILENENKNKNDDDDELLNECYDIMPCNNISKITNSNKGFFKIF